MRPLLCNVHVQTSIQSRVHPLRSYQSLNLGSLYLFWMQMYIILHPQTALKLQWRDPLQTISVR